MKEKKGLLPKKEKFAFQVFLPSMSRGSVHNLGPTLTGVREQERAELTELWWLAAARALALGAQCRRPALFLASLRSAL